MLLPHLSHDWEAGRRDQVSARMNLTLKLLGLLLFVGSIAILLSAPFLFNVAFAGKFARGMDVFPWTLTYCAWFGLATMAQMYLWCAERARLSCLALGLGLTTNIVLNLILLPKFGLSGAVWATAAANFIALALLYRFNGWFGMKIQRSMLLVSLLPLSLGFGVWFSLATLATVILAIAKTDWIFSRDEKKELLGACDGYVSRFRRKRPAPSQATAATPASFAMNDVSTIAEPNDMPPQRPLRVMFIITSMHTGGAETLLLNLVRRLDRARFSPELCCMKEAGILGDELAKEMPVHANLLQHKYDFRVLGRLTKLLRDRQIRCRHHGRRRRQNVLGSFGGASREGARRHFRAAFDRLARQHQLAQSTVDRADRRLRGRGRPACEIPDRGGKTAPQASLYHPQRRRHGNILPGSAICRILELPLAIRQHPTIAAAKSEIVYDMTSEFRDPPRSSESSHSCVPKKIMNCFCALLPECVATCPRRSF